MSSKTKKGSKSLQSNKDTEFPELTSPAENINGKATGMDETQSLPINLHSKTPLRSQRVDEKNLLIGFNNRLAAIIEKNHQLEHANKTLKKEVHKAEENLSFTVTRLETTFGKEVDETRKQLQDANKENTKLQLNESKMRSELHELHNKMDKKDKEAAELKDKLSYADEQITKLSGQIQQASNKCTDLTKDNKDLEEEKFRLAQELSELRCKYEEECIAKAGLQDLIKGKIDEYNTKIHLYEQQVLDVKKIRALELEEVDGKLQKEYEMKLQNALKELRTDYEMEIERNKDEQKNLYNKKESDLVSQINKLSQVVSAKVQELEVLQAKLDDAIKKAADLEGEKHTININIQELEKKIKHDKEQFSQEREKKEAENDDLRKEKADLIAEYLDLLETRTALDNELATYRVLLEGEEQRLKLTPQTTKMDVNENNIAPNQSETEYQ